MTDIAINSNTTNEQPIESTNPNTKDYLASYTQRFAAFTIDYVLLIVIALALGALMTDLFAAMGAWGVMVGFVLTFVYFTVGDSKLANGQTLGKRLFRIQVVDRINSNQNAIKLDNANHHSGNLNDADQCLTDQSNANLSSANLSNTGQHSEALLSLPKSALRYLIIGVPIALNGAILPSHSFAQLQALLVGTLIFGSLATLLYLAVANKRLKQLLQDIVVDAVVIKTRSTYRTVPATPVRVLQVSAVLFIAIGAIVWFVNSKVQSSSLTKTLDELFKVQAVIEENPYIRYTQINSNVHTLINNNQKTVAHSLIVVAHLSKDILFDEPFAIELAKQAVNNYSQSDGLDGVTVVLMYGYNLGIASSNRSQTYQFQVNELTGES